MSCKEKKQCALSYALASHALKAPATVAAESFWRLDKHCAKIVAQRNISAGGLGKQHLPPLAHESCPSSWDGRPLLPLLHQYLANLSPTVAFGDSGCQRPQDVLMSMFRRES